MTEEKSEPQASQPSKGGDQGPTQGDTDHHTSDPEPAEDLVIVAFEPNDPANPYNWSATRKFAIVLAAILGTTTTSFYSTLPSNFAPPLTVDFAVADPSGPQRILPASVYLIGYVFGPLVWAPLSESPRVGRWRVLAVGAVLYVLMSVGQAAVRTWGGFLALRFLSGVCGSPPISVFGGVIADVFEGDLVRGRVRMVWTLTTFVAPLVAPILAGFVSTSLGWRAVFWVALSLGVASLIAVLFTPETLASALLRRRAAKLNRENLNTGRRFVASSDLVRESAWVAYKTTLLRPWRMLFRELVVSLSCAYMGFVYAVFYMQIQIFPFVFQGVYGFSPGMTGVLFAVAAGLGTLIGCLVCLWFDGVAPRLSAKHPTKKEEYHRLPLACIGGPLYVVSILWLGWAARLSVHWIVPLLSMVPYGLAYNLIYVTMINYVADAYGIYAASALAALSMTRSAAGALLPLAIEDMLAALGIAWSCTVLAGASAALAAVPFAFLAYGERIRAGSRFSATVRKDEGEGRALGAESRGEGGGGAEGIVVPGRDGAGEDV